MTKKYRERLKTMNAVTWKNIQIYAKQAKQHIAVYMYWGLEITAADIRANGGYTGELWQELKEWHAKRVDCVKSA